MYIHDAAWGNLQFCTHVISNCVNMSHLASALLTILQPFQHIHTSKSIPWCPVIMH